MSKINFREIVALINPIKPPAGLSLSDSAFRYVEVKDDQSISKAALRLPPGIIEDGKIKDRRLALGALKTLKTYINPSNKVDVIVSLPSSLVYSRVFSMPNLEEDALDEAAKLNLQMISPIDLKQAYYSYEIVGTSNTNQKQTELLGAFLPIASAKEWTEVLDEAGFGVAAIEFESLGAVRSAGFLKMIEPNNVYVVLRVSAEGLDFIVIKNNALYFDYFYEWKSASEGAKTITTEKLVQILTSETERVLNFIASKFSGEVFKFFVLPQGEGKEIVNIIASRFPKLKVEEVKSDWLGSPANWFGALGAAVRGRIPRGEDKLIGLSATTMLEEYFQSQVISIIKIARNSILTTLAFIVLIFSFSDLFLRQSKIALASQSIADLPVKEMTELSGLRNQVKEFNSLVKSVALAKDSKTKLSPLFIKLKSLAGTSTQLQRISMSSRKDMKILLTATSSSPAEAGNFKDKLSSLPQIKSFEQLIANQKVNADGSVTFTVTFKLTGMDF